MGISITLPLPSHSLLLFHAIVLFWFCFVLFFCSVLFSVCSSFPFVSFIISFVLLFSFPFSLPYVAIPPLIFILSYFLSSSLHPFPAAFVYIFPLTLHPGANMRIYLLVQP